MSRPKGFVCPESTRVKIAEAKRGKPNPLVRGERHGRWNGGRRKTVRGYVLVLAPGHPGSDCAGYVYEHRLIMEAHLGRPLLPNEVVHHINGILDDNRIENLMRFDGQADHLGWHREVRRGL